MQKKIRQKGNKYYWGWKPSVAEALEIAVVVIAIIFLIWQIVRG